MFSIKTLMLALALTCFATFADDEAFWMKDGQVFTCQNGQSSVLSYETTFPDGSRLMPDGTLIKADGTRQVLTNDQAISSEGRLLQRNGTETAIRSDVKVQSENTQPSTTVNNNTAPQNQNNIVPPLNDSTTEATKQNSRDIPPSNTDNKPTLPDANQDNNKNNADNPDNPDNTKGGEYQD